LWLILAMLVSAGPSFAVGEPVNGFPSWYERMIHVLTNRARCDPAAALVGCSPCGDVDLGCYAPVPPVQWNEDLNRAARFHATNLVDSGCSMQHVSPCVLDANIGATYPDVCDGSVSCACASPVSCVVAGTNTWDRLALFGVTGGYRAENIAWLGPDPFSTMDLWLLEPMTSSTCDYRCASYNDCNGHRYSLLNPAHTRIGVGGYGDYVVQDFWGTGDIDQKIPSAAHFPEDGGPATEFRANWYDSAPPNAALVNIDGQCFPMVLERGSGDNGTYLYTTETSGCSRYYFEFRDAADQLVVYPETGSFGIGCTNWEPTRPASCAVSAVGESTPRFGLLEQNYPNPFNPRTSIVFVLPSERAVSLCVYDAAGRLVDVLMDDEIARRGRNEVVWRGRDADGRMVPAGVYFYRLVAGPYSQTMRMALVK
jgi:hypothetical protein